MMKEQESLLHMTHLADARGRVHGVGVYEGKVLYVKKRLSHEELHADALVVRIETGFMFLCFFALIGGLGSLLYFIFIIQPVELFSVQDIIQSQSLFVRLWLYSLVCLPFLIYYRLLSTHRLVSVVSKNFESVQEVPPRVTSFEQVLALPRKDRIDIFRSCTLDTLRIVHKASELAREYKHEQVLAIHLFIAAVLIDAHVQTLFYRLGIDLKQLIASLVRGVDRYTFGQGVIGEACESLLIKAYKEASVANQRFISPLELCVVAYREDSFIQEILYDKNIEKDDFENGIEWIRITRALQDRYRRYASAGKFRNKHGIDRALTSMGTQFLNTISHDITRSAQQGYLDMIVGRDKEYNELYRIFTSGSRGVVFVGAPGVGKTALIEGLAQRIVGNDVPLFLKEHRVVMISVSQLIAGAGASEVQERLLHALGEAYKAKNVIVVFDNLHELVGVGAVGVGADMASILADVAQKNALYIIGLVSDREYTQYIEGTQLGSALRTIRVEEMSQQDAIVTLESKVLYVEARQQVAFSYQAVKAIVEYTHRYIHDQMLPSKAILVMEEVAVYVVQKKGRNAVVTREDVAELLTEKLGIPIREVSTEEANQLLDLEEMLQQRVIGQEDAVAAVATALRRARTALRDQNRPIASFLFLGSTGVGKTELTKAIADVYFGSVDSMVRFDMSEYQNMSDLYKLIGAPTGTGGSQEGLLTEAIRKNPYTIILLDEFEKAHTDILNVFLQVLDDGRLTDASGRTIDFTNAIIIATSNAGTEFIQDQIRAGTDITQIRQALFATVLQRYFKPELINRFDDVVVFRPLDQKSIVAIARLLLGRVVAQMEQKGITLRVTDAALEKLAQEGFDPVYGARPLRRVMQERLDAALAKYLLQGKLGRRDVVVYDVGGRITVEKADQL